MDNPDDQTATLPETELPDIGLPEEGGLPDLGTDDLASNDLPDLGAEAPMDLNMDDDLPDLGSDNELPDLGMENDLPDLGDDAGLPDLGMDNELPDLGMDSSLPDLNAASELDVGDTGGVSSLDLSDLKSPVPAAAAVAASAVNSFGDTVAKQASNSTSESNSASGDSVMAFRKIQGIKVRVQVILGETRLSVSQLANLKKGEFVRLDTKVGQAVDILANGALIARGEIAVEDEETPRFGITLTEIIDSSLLSN